MNHRISEEVVKALMTLTFDGNKATMPNLPRPLYVATNKVLELAGGKWSKKEKAHVFPDDAEDIIADAIVTGEILDRKKAFQYFPTPDTLADTMVELAHVTDSHRVLEPSAGDGAIVRAILRACPGVAIDAFDIDPKHQARLFALRISGWCLDFLEYNTVRRYDRIIANPPFRNGQDVKHVLHMWDILAPGGKIVALTSSAWTFRTNRQNTDFRAFLSDHMTKNIHIPAGTFPGTGIRTELIVLDKK